jgi:acetyl-CoA carboxylase carboxyl transferase subunit alpha
MAALKTPIISVVIGEGGSGGALAIGLCDRLLMLQYATYSVISPEGCASILWKSADKADIAAEAMGITATRLKRLGLIDEVIPEPLGGAHRDVGAMAETLGNALISAVNDLRDASPETLVSKRTARLMQFGEFEER